MPEVEVESAKAIATKLEKLEGVKPLIKSDSAISKQDKEGYNLILVGTPNSNNTLTEIYQTTHATRVTVEYPGKNKGVLEILRNPWNLNRALLIVAGSNEWGTKASSEILGYVRDLNKPNVIVDWDDLAKDKQAVVLGLAPSEFRVLDEKVREYFSKFFPGAEFPIIYQRMPELEYLPGVIVIRVTARVILPSPSATFGFYKGKVFLISEIEYP